MQYEDEDEEMTYDEALASILQAILGSIEKLTQSIEDLRVDIRRIETGGGHF